VGFVVPPDAYSRFMGRYADPLAKVFVAFAGVGAGAKVLDAGCGPGALTAHLLSVGAEVAAIDPSPPFIDAMRVRFPDVDVREGVAEELPYDTATFDAALAQLVVHFMSDPVVGVRQMARVTRPGGVIAACVWDGPTGALAPFWAAVHTIDPDADDEALLSGAHRGHLTEIFENAGLRDVAEDSISVDVVHPTFEEWWEPYTYGVGPAGDYVQRLDDDGRAHLESVARERLGNGPFTVTATAWAARGTVRFQRARLSVRVDPNSGGRPDNEDPQIEMLYHAVLEEMEAINAVCDFDVSEESLQILAESVTSRIDSAFAVRWSPAWVPLGRPHLWRDKHGWRAVCTDCLAQSPASGTEDEAVAWFDDHSDQQHPQHQAN
jgi:SAM-dependent methyltransferase